MVGCLLLLPDFESLVTVILNILAAVVANEMTVVVEHNECGDAVDAVSLFH